MTFKAHIDKWNNKPCDLDGFPKSQPWQCVDLIRAYCKEVLGVSAYTLPTASYAYQIFSKIPDAGTSQFTKVYNNPRDPKQIPPQGAILFWKPWVLGITGIGGHTAVNWQAYLNTDKFISWDQNWPTRSYCHLQTHSYRGLWGWLVFKK